eukprot:TRINITY_DN10464_c0_g1_i1.p1 TRINITY_DN10464_c0_g1~~TRINITY_DN10464_c0_g1_i1.p1  ORF type:complete len:435 (+),score=111.40 TRINITY_DN10464_c0_g1_i1:65-1306(+)
MGAHASTTPSPLQHEWPSGLGEEEWCAGDDYSSSGDEAGEGMTIPSSLLAADVSYWRQRGDLARQAMLDAQRAASFAEQRLAAAEQLAGAAAKQDAALARGTELICQQLREPGKRRRPRRAPPANPAGAGAAAAAAYEGGSSSAPSTPLTPHALSDRALLAGAPVDGRPQHYYISGRAAAAARPTTLAPRREDYCSGVRPTRLRALATAYPPRPCVGLGAEDAAMQFMVDEFYLGGVLPPDLPRRLAQGFLRRASGSGGKRCPGWRGAEGERVLEWWLRGRLGFGFDEDGCGSHSQAAASFAQLALLHTRCTIRRSDADEWLELMFDTLDEVVPDPLQQPPPAAESPRGAPPQAGPDPPEAAEGPTLQPEAPPAVPLETTRAQGRPGPEDVAAARAALIELFRVLSAALVKDY